MNRLGDPVLSTFTRAQASDFLDELAEGRTARTLNGYTMLFAAVFDHAKRRGRFVGENPFADQRRQVAQGDRTPFTPNELGKLFGYFRYNL
jgi:hypothetical protein